MNAFLSMTSTRSSMKELLHSRRFKLFIQRAWEICWFWTNSKVRFDLKQAIWRIFQDLTFFYHIDIAESDLIYTETLMQRGTENYEGKEICILGGGDGALLYELLKENPKFVTMLEIDEMVMQVCNKYLKSICGDVLELRKSENFEVNCRSNNWFVVFHQLSFE